MSTETTIADPEQPQPPPGKRLNRRQVLKASALVGAGTAGLALVGCGASGDDGELVHPQEELTTLKDENKELKKEVRSIARGGAAEGGHETAAEGGHETAAEAGHGAAQPLAAHPEGEGRPNGPTSFNPDIESPDIDPSAYIDPKASVIRNVHIGSRVYVAPFASARGDEGQPIFIDDGSNLQDGVVIHALETIEGGEEVSGNLVKVGGNKYAVHVGKNVSLAHQSHVHGPARVGDDTFIGMQALLFKAQVGSNCVVEPKALVMGVTVADGHYVPAGALITKQEQADALPVITDDYAFKSLNAAVLHVNQQLADGYNGVAAQPHVSNALPEGGHE